MGPPMQLVGPLQGPPAQTAASLGSPLLLLLTLLRLLPQRLLLLLRERGPVPQMGAPLGKSH